MDIVIAITAILSRWLLHPSSFSKLCRGPERNGHPELKTPGPTRPKRTPIAALGSSIGDPAVSALYGKVANNEFAVLVKLGVFTTQAQNFATSKSNLRLIEGEELVELIFQHYEQFDLRYKGLLPLRRVYVPEAIDTDEG